MTGENEAAAIVAELMVKARAAQAVYAGFSQQQIDDAVTAVAWTLLDPDTNRRLSEQAVADTGMGVVEDDSCNFFSREDRQAVEQRLISCNAWSEIGRAHV